MISGCTKWVRSIWAKARSHTEGWWRIWIHILPVMRMYGCESWSIKKAEHWRIDAFELWCWRRLLRVPWTAKRSNQSILKEISPGCSLERLCWSWNANTLATWCEELTHLKRPWYQERSRAGGEGDERGGEGDERGWDGWVASPTLWTWVWVNSGNWWWTGRPGMLWFLGSERVGHYWVTALNCTELSDEESKDLKLKHFIFCYCINTNKVLLVREYDTYRTDRQYLESHCYFVWK